MKKNLALAAIALVFLLSAAQAQSPNSPNSSIQDQLKTIQAGISDLKAQNDSLAAQNAALAAQVAANGPRKFYLTKTTTNGAGPLTACAMGYHMASLWEILDPTNLRYNKGLGVTSGDSGFGPPTNIMGWIRTGFDSFASFEPGAANCNAWTTTTGNGTAVFLPAAWGDGQLPVEVVAPWIVAGGTTCGIEIQVWCVQD